MTGFEDELWTRLVDDHGADEVRLNADPRTGRSRRPLLLGGGATAIGAAAAAAVIGFGATGGTTPAYAMTQNADGSYTFTINDLATAAPELNAKFKQLGINETVVPATASCPAASTGDISHELMLYPGASLSEALTFEPGHKWLEPGYTGVIGAEQLPDGQIAMNMEAVPAADIPSCFPTQAVKIVRIPGTNTLTAQQLTTPASPGS